MQIWNTARQCLTNLSGHNGAVKSVEWVSIDEEQKSKRKRMKFISGSQDQSVVVWDWSETSGGGGGVEKMVKCIGHTESVECVGVSPDRTKVISWGMFELSRTLI